MSQRLNGLVSASRAAINSDWFNLANFFTALRVVLVAPIILLLLYRSGDMSVDVVTGLLFVAAALTDKADGYFARKNDTITRIGQFLDPLADKLLMIPVMITLWSVDRLALWVVLVVVVREILISAIRIIGARRGISFPASWSGKVKMFSQVVVVSVLIFFPASSQNAFVLVLVYTMAAITAYSGVDYLFRARREIFRRPAGQSKPS